MNPSILLPNFRNAPLIRNNFNWVLKNLDSSVQRTTFLAPIKNQNIAHTGGAKRGKIPAYDWLKKWREYFSYRRSKKWREQNDSDLTTENTHMKLPCDGYTKNNPPKTCTFFDFEQTPFNSLTRRLGFWLVNSLLSCSLPTDTFFPPSGALLSRLSLLLVFGHLRVVPVSVILNPLQDLRRVWMNEVAPSLPKRLNNKVDKYNLGKEKYRRPLNRGGSVAEWLERWTCNLEATSSSPARTFIWIFSLLVPSSNPRPRLWNRQLVRLLPTGILKLVMFHLNYLFHYPWEAQ